MKKKPQPIRLVRLAGSVWESWEFASPARPRRIEDSADLQEAPNSILAVSARSVIAAPIWVSATDPEIVRTSIALELELRGLLPKKRSSDAVVSKTIVKGDRTLVVARIFPTALAETFENRAFSRYEASPLLLSLEENSATFWTEAEDMVVAFTRGRDVVYWATSRPANSRGLEKWIEMLVAYLTSLGILEKPPARYLIDEQMGDNSVMFPETFEPDAKIRFSRIALFPSLEHATFEWKPESAHHAERKSLSTAKARRVLSSLAAVYFAVALAAGIYVALLYAKERRLKAQVSNLEAQVGSFAPIIQGWQEIGPSAEQQAFPLEILHFVVKNLPKDGIRLTTYDVTDGHVVIEGEATSASLASQFFGSVSKDAGLSGFHWEMPPPALLPSSAARFHINGAAQ